MRKIFFITGGQGMLQSAKKTKVIYVMLFILIILSFSVTFSSFWGRVNQVHAEEINFTILHTNDEHSALIPHSPAVDHDPLTDDPEMDPTRGGFARLGSAAADIRARKEEKQEPVFLLNAGDFIGGSLFGWLSLRNQAPELKLLQEIGYDVAVIGNHEFDYGPDILADYLREAGYPEAHDSTVILASNVEPPVDHPLSAENLIRYTQIMEVADEFTMGLFSLVGKDAVEVMADSGEVSFTDQHQTAHRKVDFLKEQGADIIVAVTHSGVQEDKELAREVENIDLIVGGHSHTPLYEPLQVDNTIIVQAGAYLDYLGQLELAYDVEEQKLRIRNNDHTPFLIPLDSTVQPEPQIAELIAEYQQELNNLIAEMSGGLYEDVMDPVAQSDFTIRSYPSAEETPGGNFVTDAMRLVTEEITGQQVDIAVQASGNIRKDIIPGREGYIALYDLVEAVGLGLGSDGYPGYPVVSVYFTGKEISYILEVAVLLEELMGDHYFLQFSGLYYDYNPADAVLMQLPFLNIPLPTTRAVKNAGIYRGAGIQPAARNNEFEILKGDENKLYHLVTDSYIFSFLPLAEEMLPQVEFTPRFEDGTPLSMSEIDNLKVEFRDRELKVWETVVMYADSLSREDSEMNNRTGVIPDYYSAQAQRINKVQTFGYQNWLILTAVLFAAAGAVVIWRHKS